METKPFLSLGECFRFATNVTGLQLKTCPRAVFSPFIFHSLSHLFSFDSACELPNVSTCSVLLTRVKRGRRPVEIINTADFSFPPKQSHVTNMSSICWTYNYGYSSCWHLARDKPRALPPSRAPQLKFARRRLFGTLFKNFIQSLSAPSLGEVKKERF